MNYNTTDSILWRFDDKEEPVTTCDACMASLDEWEVEDPIEIDNRILCDRCASEVMRSKLPGIMRELKLAEG